MICRKKMSGPGVPKAGVWGRLPLGWTLLRRWHLMEPNSSLGDEHSGLLLAQLAQRGIHGAGGEQPRGCLAEAEEEKQSGSKERPRG